MSKANEALQQAWQETYNNRQRIADLGFDEAWFSRDGSLSAGNKSIRLSPSASIEIRVNKTRSKLPGRRYRIDFTAVSPELYAYGESEWTTLGEKYAADEEGVKAVINELTQMLARLAEFFK